MSWRKRSTYSSLSVPHFSWIKARCKWPRRTAKQDRGFRKFTFIWKIKNFHLFEFDGDIESPTFDLPFGRNENDQFFKLSLCCPFVGANDLCNVPNDLETEVRLQNCNGEDNLDRKCGEPLLSFSLSVTRLDGNLECFHKSRILPGFKVEFGKCSFKNVKDIFNSCIFDDALTFRCDFEGRVQSFSSEKDSACTEFVAETHTFTWDLDNIWSSLSERRHSIPKLGIDLSLLPHRDTPMLVDTGYIHSHAITIKKATEICRVYTQVCAQSEDGELRDICVLDLKDRDAVAASERNLKHEDYYEGYNKAKFIHDGHMKLLFTFYIQTGDMESRIRQSDSAEDRALKFSQEHQPTSEASEIVDAMSLLYSDKAHSDFVLRAGGKSFPVHKAILCVRSPVFQAMFSTDMREKKDNSTDIKDVDSGTMDALLRFIYYGDVQLPPDYESCLKLFFAADKYQVMSLQKACLFNLHQHVSEESVCDILRLADSIGNEPLKEMTMAFVTKNWKCVVRSPQFKQLMAEHTELASSIMENISQKTK